MVVTIPAHLGFSRTAETQGGRTLWVTTRLMKCFVIGPIGEEVLTFANPNVYYELAIAQSACRPVGKTLQLYADSRVD